MNAKRFHRVLRWFGLTLFVLLGAGILFLFLFMPPMVDRAKNTVARRGPFKVSGEAQALHQELLVADLHCDTLVWPRNLLEASSRGHVDLPPPPRGQCRDSGLFRGYPRPGPTRPGRTLAQIRQS